jgi:hypothetical protein
MARKPSSHEIPSEVGAIKIRCACTALGSVEELMKKRSQVLRRKINEIIVARL